MSARKRGRDDLARRELELEVRDLIRACPEEKLPEIACATVVSASQSSVDYISPIFIEG